MRITNNIGVMLDFALWSVNFANVSVPIKITFTV